MNEVVASIQFDHVVECFLAALGVDTHSLEVCSTCSLQESQISASERREESKSFFMIRLSVAMALSPQILIVARKLRLIVRKDHPKPIAKNQLRVCKML